MTGAPAPTDAVGRGLAVLEPLRGQLEDATWQAELDALTVSGRLAALGGADARALLGLRTDGHVVEIRADGGPWSLTVRADSPAAPSVDADDSPEQALSAARADELERAVARGDAAAALDAAGELPGRVTVRLRHDPIGTGHHWIDSERSLTDLLTSPKWLPTAVALAGGPGRVVVGDWRGEHVTTAGLRFAGQAAAPAPASGASPAVPGHVGSSDGRPALPSPALFARPAGNAPADGPDGGLRGLLHGLARRLSWYWLANDAQLDSDGTLLLTVTGARSVELRLGPDRAAHSDADVALYEWAFSGPDPGRLEAARQAASLALVTQADLPTAARPALRTARSLHELSRRGEVGEALAARRTARDAASNAARQAAAAARQAAGKATERLLLQSAALAAVVLARANDLVASGLAAVLAGIIGLLTAVAWAVTARVELPSAKDGLAAELDDLGQYRDTLSQDDIDAVRGMRSGTSASEDLGRARVAVHAVYGLALVAAAAAAVAVLAI